MIGDIYVDPGPDLRTRTPFRPSVSWSDQSGVRPLVSRAHPARTRKTTIDTSPAISASASSGRARMTRKTTIAIRAGPLGRDCANRRNPAAPGKPPPGNPPPRGPPGDGPVPGPPVMGWLPRSSLRQSVPGGRRGGPRSTSQRSPRRWDDARAWPPPRDPHQGGPAGPGRSLEAHANLSW